MKILINIYLYNHPVWMSYKHKTEGLTSKRSEHMTLFNCVTCAVFRAHRGDGVGHRGLPGVWQAGLRQHVHRAGGRPARSDGWGVRGQDGQGWGACRSVLRLDIIIETWRQDFIIETFRQDFRIDKNLPQDFAIFWGDQVSNNRG